MNKTTRLALVALAGFGLSASGAMTDTTWWDVDFGSPTSNGVDLVQGELGNLTNSVEYSGAAGLQPYASGVWYADVSDESYVTNGIVTNMVDGVASESYHLALSTQGNDLRWTPTNTVANKIALVDADILLVGSDSAPDAADFDAGGDVQTAIYLKNFIDEENGGEVTNSLLCVYVYDTIRLVSYWQELDGTPLSDNSWHHVRVLVDYTPVEDGDVATVQVFVDDMNTPMHARDDASTTSWTVANRRNNFTRLSSVSFRGTGAIDNFVGKTREYQTLTFEAAVYIDKDKQAYDDLDEGGNLSRFVAAKAGNPGSGKTVKFEDFLVDDFDMSDPDTPTYGLYKIVWTNFVTGTTKTITYEYDDSDSSVVPSEDSDDFDFNLLSGEFDVTASTDGAVDPTNLVVQIYFKTIGAWEALDVVDMAGAVTTNGFFVKPDDIPMTTNWTFNAVEGGNILSNIVCYGGAAFASFENGVATVTNAFTAALAADTVFVKATYVPGTLDARQELRATVDGGTVVFAPYTLPVAITVSANGALTNDCTTLAAAIATVPDGGTVVLVDTVAEGVRHTRQDVAFTLDLNGQNWNYVLDDNYAAFKNDGGVVTIVDSVGTGKIEVAPNPNFATDKADGFCVWARTGSIEIEGGSFVNDSNVDYAAYVGTYDSNFWNGAPTITIRGGTFTNKNTEAYGHNPSLGHSLNLNVINHDSTHLLACTEQIQVSGGTFTYDPALGDDVMGGTFVAPGYESVAGAGVWTVEPAAYDIEFWADGTKVFETNGVAYLATNYGPTNDPAKAGCTFDGWTNGVVVTPVATTNLPAATGDAVWTAVFTASASPDPVDPGASMTPAEKLAKPPVAVVTDPDSGDVSFTVHFKGEEGVTYSLVASTDCSITEEQWLGEATGADASGNAVTVDTATTADADENGIITLEAPMTDSDPDVMFFKIKASR